jgi:hypothetical protein
MPSYHWFHSTNANVKLMNNDGSIYVGCCGDLPSSILCQFSGTEVDTDGFLPHY